MRLCRSIARVCGLKVEDPLGDSAARDTAPVMSALPEGVTLVGSRRLGLVWLIEALWERLGIGATLRQVLTPSQDAPRFERALLAMTANRLCDPQSKLGVWERWRETVYLPGAEQLTKDDLYAAMDALHAQAAEIEQAVFFHTADLFKLEVDLLFYDTTTCTFAIDEDDEDELRRFGRPKDGAWAPQVVVALAVTREGLPVREYRCFRATLRMRPRSSASKRTCVAGSLAVRSLSPMRACIPRRTARSLPAGWASTCWQCP